MGSTDGDLQPVVPHLLRQALLDRVDIAAARVLDPLGAPDLRGFGERRLLRQPRLDLRLVGVGQLEAVGAEQFYAVRSEESRGGKECVSTCRSRWSPSH